MHQPKKHRKYLFPPKIWDFWVSPFVTPGSSWFSLSYCVSHPICEFSTSKSDIPWFFFFPRLLLLPSIFFCSVSLSFSSSPVSAFLSLFMLCSLCLCLFTFLLLCFLVQFFFLVFWWIFFFSWLLVFLWLVLFCLFLFRLPCSYLPSCSSSSFSSSSSSFFVLLPLLFVSCSCFFLFFFCSSVLRSKLRWWRFSWLLCCVVFFLDPPSRMDLRRQNAKSCTLFFGTFALKPLFQIKPSPPRAWGFLSAVFLHKSVILCFLQQTAKRKWTRWFLGSFCQPECCWRFKNRGFGHSACSFQKGHFGPEIVSSRMGPGMGSILGPLYCTTWRPLYWTHERCARKSQNRTSWYIELQPNTGGGGNVFFCYFRRPFQLRISAPFLHLWIPKSGPVFEVYSIYIYIYTLAPTILAPACNFLSMVPHSQSKAQVPDYCLTLSTSPCNAHNQE